MYYVYVLRSIKDGKRYIGLTGDIERRRREHNLGMVKSTKKRLPMELIYCEEYQNKREAMLREKFLKTGKGREWMKINNT